MMIGLILIYKEDFSKVKIEIYYQTIGVITKNMPKSLFLYIVIWLRIGLEKAAVENVLMISANKNRWQYHPIIIDMIVNNKELLVIIGIKLGMQFQCTRYLSRNVKIYTKQRP